jgi:RNA polymerase sigma factor (sigma-70 family)
MREDHVLVQQCLKGSEEAWSELIDKYKNLIFSIPVKYGFSSQDAADIFQAVCLSLLAELPAVREPRALPAWLIQTTSRKCYRWRDQSERRLESEREGGKGTQEPPKIGEDMLRELEREQQLREAVSELPPDCQRVVNLLFYSAEPFSYERIAQSLGVSAGSIGPTRMRCLGKLRRALEQRGFLR